VSEFDTEWRAESWATRRFLARQEKSTTLIYVPYKFRLKFETLSYFFVSFLIKQNKNYYNNNNKQVFHSSKKLQNEQNYQSKKMNCWQGIQLNKFI